MTGIYLFSNRTRTLKGTRTPHHNIPRYSSISVLGLIGVAAPFRSRYINSPATGINHRRLTPPPQISVLVSISVSVSAHCALQSETVPVTCPWIQIRIHSVPRRKSITIDIDGCILSCADSVLWSPTFRVDAHISHVLTYLLSQHLGAEYRGH